MKLKLKAIVVVSISMILLITLFLSFLRPVLLKESSNLDRDNTLGEVKRIQNNIQSTMKDLGKVNRDWAIWDDTYNFMIDQNPLYIERNLQQETLENMQLNFYIYIDNQKNPKLQLGYDLEDNEIVTLQDNFYKEFLPIIGRISNISDELIVMSKNGLAMASFETVYQSNGEGPPVGTLIIGKYIDEHTIRRIGEELSLKLDFQEAKSTMKTNEQIRVEVLNDQQMIGSVLLPDYSKESFFEISFHAYRNFYIEKKETVNNIAICLVIAGIVFVFLTIFLLNRFILIRISNLSEQLYQIQMEGNVNSRIASTKNQHDEISKLENSINQMLSSLEEKHDEVSELALYDHLTELPNRYMFYQEAANRMKGHTEELIVLFFDLDGFKQVNDTFGHEMGDQLLKELSRRVQLIVKEKNGLVARYGGDEFLVLFDQMDPEELEGIVQKILGGIGRKYKFDNCSTFVTASIGISMYPRDGITIDQVLKNADEAMYEAKSKGKNQYVMFHEIND